MSDCTPADFSFAGDTQHLVKCLTREESVAYFAAIFVTTISLLALLWLFYRIFKGAIHHLRHAPQPRRLFPIEIYLLSLFAGDLVELFGDTLNIRWVVLGRIQTGGYCTAQAYIATVGETAAAITTLAIAVYTFVLVWWKKGYNSLLVPCLVVGMSWAFGFIFSLVLLLNARKRREELYAPTPYWCWIHLAIWYKLVAFYLWAWLALGFSLVCYVPLFLLRRGHITLKQDDPWWKLHFHRQRAFHGNLNVQGNAVVQRKVDLHAFDMIFYPLVYSVVVLPLSAARWKQFESNQWHNIAMTLVGSAIYDLTGLLNVLLFIYTRQGLLFFDEGARSGGVGAADAEADGALEDDAGAVAGADDNAVAGTG